MPSRRRKPATTPARIAYLSTPLSCRRRDAYGFPSVRLQEDTDYMRRRLNYANVIATIALFFAISGGALAAKRYLINSTKQISPKVLKALKGNSGRPGSSGAMGKEGLQGKEGAPGKEGATGKTGATGAAGTA